MPTKVIQYKDATVTVHAPVFGEVTIDVDCRNYHASGLTTDQFAQLIYPVIDALENPRSDTDS
jgi:hypothetical protein